MPTASEIFSDSPQMYDPNDGWKPNTPQGGMPHRERDVASMGASQPSTVSSHGRLYEDGSMELDDIMSDDMIVLDKLRNEEPVAGQTAIAGASLLAKFTSFDGTAPIRYAWDEYHLTPGTGVPSLVAGGQSGTTSSNFVVDMVSYTETNAGLRRNLVDEFGIITPITTTVGSTLWAIRDVFTRHPDVFFADIVETSGSAPFIYTSAAVHYSEIAVASAALQNDQAAGAIRVLAASGPSLIYLDAAEDIHPWSQEAIDWRQCVGDP